MDGRPEEYSSATAVGVNITRLEGEETAIHTLLSSCVWLGMAVVALTQRTTAMKLTATVTNREDTSVNNIPRDKTLSINFGGVENFTLVGVENSHQSEGENKV
jgi:hypothetical protein